MKTKMKSLVLILVGMSALSSNAVAGKYLSQQQIDESIAFLPEPPTEDSDTFKKDFIILEYINQTRTEKECKEDAIEADLLMPMPFEGEDGLLSADEIANWKGFASAIYYEVKPITKGLKNRFKRPRPYVTRPDLKACVPEELGTFAYPSAHATAGELYAKIFSEAYAERSKVFLERGRQYGNHRVVGGVHHPSDIKAGQSLADHVFEQLMLIPDFRNDLELAKEGKFVAPPAPAK